MYYIKEQQRQALRKRLIAGYQARAERDRSLAKEWRPLEQEAWQEHIEPVEEQSDTAALSTRRRLDGEP